MQQHHDEVQWVSFAWDLESPRSALEPVYKKLLDAAQAAKGETEPVLKVLAEERALSIPLLTQWEFLATVAAVDLAAARTLEPHLDALGILREAADAGSAIRIPEGSTWGVFAAEAPNAKLTATHTPSGWVLKGTKAWCSLAGQLSHAIVTAWVDDTRRGTFGIDLKHPGVIVEDSSQWHATGLKNIVSNPISFTDVPAHAVGEPDWYLTRPNFAAGGIGVAACWFGGAVGLFRSMLAKATHRAPDQIAHARLGLVDRHLAAAASSFTLSAQRAERGTVDWAEAHRTRGIAEQACRVALAAAGESLGPAALAFDEDHSRRVADLDLYIRQHHGARDDAALGELILESGHSW